MTLYSFTGSATTLGTGPLVSGDILIVGETGHVLAPSETLAVSAGASGVAILVAGELVLDTLAMAGTGDITICQTGSLAAMDTAEAILLSGNGTQMVNEGQINALRGGGITATGSNIRIENTGSIHGDTYGVSLGNNTLSNLGDIYGGQGVLALGTATKIANDGSIRALGTTLLLGGENVPGNIAATHFILNRGLIASTNATTIEGSFQLGSSIVTLVNSGMISGSVAILLSGQSSDRITNSGTIQGDIFLSSGNDSFIGGGGSVSGNINMGGGNDSVDLRGGKLFGSVSGGLGLDTYRIDDSDTNILEEGADADFVLANCSYRLANLVDNLTLIGAQDWRGQGNGLSNTIVGNHGDNRLTGAESNDTLSGSLGNDTLHGNSQNDSLSGDDGEDSLLGGIGNDALSGGDGDDVLIGGLGQDALNGGAGADEFRFTSAAHLATTQAATDNIAGFTRGEDVINLAGIDAKSNNTLSNDSFTFIGAAAFSAVAGQVRVVAGATTVVQMDLDGNSVADLFLTLSGSLTLGASDFIL